MGTVNESNETRKKTRKISNIKLECMYINKSWSKWLRFLDAYVRLRNAFKNSRNIWFSRENVINHPLLVLVLIYNVNFHCDFDRKQLEKEKLLIFHAFNPSFGLESIKSFKPITHVYFAWVCVCMYIIFCVRFGCKKIWKFHDFIEFSILNSIHLMVPMGNDIDLAHSMSSIHLSL